MKREIELLNAKSDAVAYIATAKKSAFKVKEKLLQKGYSEDIAEDVLAILIEENRLNDLDYSLAFIKSRKGKQILSDRGIYQRLMQAGIDCVTIEKAIEVSGQAERGLDCELDRAYGLLKLKFDLRNTFENDTRTLGKMSRFLLSKGFEREVVREAMIKAGCKIDYE